MSTTKPPASSTLGDLLDELVTRYPSKEFIIYQDGSNGFVGDGELNAYVVSDSGFRILVMNTINGIRPQTNY